MQDAMSLDSSLFESLSKSGHYTLFAPTNIAFEKLESGVLDRILNDKTVIQGKC